MRSAMRRMFSIRPRRSIVGIAHSSPIVSGGDALELAHEELDVVACRGALRCARSARSRSRRRADSRRACPPPAWAAPGSSRAAARADLARCAPGRRRSCRAATRPTGSRRHRDRPPPPAVAGSTRECAVSRSSRFEQRALPRGRATRRQRRPQRRRQDPLPPRERARLLGEPFGAQQLTANGTREPLRVGATTDAPDALTRPREETRQKTARFLRGKTSRHAGKVAGSAGQASFLKRARSLRSARG